MKEKGRKLSPVYHTCSLPGPFSHKKGGMPAKIKLFPDGKPAHDKNMQFEKSNGQNFNKLNFRKMKKLNKLQVNYKNLMKNEELMTLKGGYGGACCMCANTTYPYEFAAMAAEDSGECRINCITAGYDTSRWDC